METTTNDTRGQANMIISESNLNLDAFASLPSTTEQRNSFYHGVGEKTDSIILL